jgi:hypothetical protein
VTPAADTTFRPYLRVLTERSRPEPIFVVALTGVDHWLRVEVPIEVLIRSPSQKLREIGRVIRAHYAERWGSAGPFGTITGYLFRTLPDRAICFSVEGVVEGEHRDPVPQGEARLRLR